MRSLIATLILAFTLVPLSASAAKQSARDVDLLANFVSNRYAYLDVKRTDWPAAARYYHIKYAAAASDRARFGVLEAMLDELYDAHTHLTANYRDSWRLPAYDIWAEPSNKGYVVTAVRGGSAAQKAGVRAGDALLLIDGDAVSDAIAARKPHFLRSPDPAADEWALLSALSGRHDRARVLRLRDTNGKTKTVTMPRDENDGTAPPDLSSSEVGGVPYIAIGSFADARVVGEFDRALTAARNSPALIIDVRNDGGGDTAVMRPIAGRFIATRQLYAWMARRSGPHLGSRWPEYIDPRGPWRYDGKVVILVDRWSESVAEGFAMAMHEARGAIVVGTPMAGLGAAVIKDHLPQNDVDAQISAEPVYDVTGKPRSDFKPDVLVDLATASGADPILTAGLAAARLFATSGPVASVRSSMKILVIGADGTMGSAVVDELKQRHEIVTAGRSHGEHTVDIADVQSIRNLFASVGKVDAVVSAAGSVHFGPLLEMTPEQLQVGIGNKLMGQVHLALEAAKNLNAGGSVTLVAGTLSKDPIRYGASASLVNGALESFVRSAALEFPAGTRINVVSPTVLRESMETYGPYFPGSEGVPGKRVALAFAKSVEGAQTGQVYYVE